MCIVDKAITAKNNSRPIEFRILRYRPESGQPAEFQSYRLNVAAAMTVLDALEQIRLNQDNTLMYRHSCHHSACGTCACMVNGVQKPACITRVLALKTDTVVLEPLAGFKRIGDLVVDMTEFYSHLESNWSLLKTAEALVEPQPSEKTSPSIPMLRLEDCIECGACVSACPVTERNTGFMGPAALAALDRQRRKVSTPQARALLEKAGGPAGERWCDRALACSRVCPTNVYPARHIAELRKALG
jgi:succinate dehydrogenase / fumarate reductase iron-sulfur subunit